MTHVYTLKIRYSGEEDDVYVFSTREKAEALSSERSLAVHSDDSDTSSSSSNDEDEDEEYGVFTRSLSRVPGVARAASAVQTGRHFPSPTGRSLW